MSSIKTCALMVSDSLCKYCYFVCILAWCSRAFFILSSCWKLILSFRVLATKLGDTLCLATPGSPAYRFKKWLEVPVNLPFSDWWPGAFSGCWKLTKVLPKTGLAPNLVAFVRAVKRIQIRMQFMISGISKKSIILNLV